MTSTLKLAWRNLGRNRRRTAITAAALAFGTCLSVATLAITEGMSAAMLDSLTALDLGHLQVHRDGYATSRDAELTLPAAEVAETARAVPGIEAATARVYGNALLGHGDTSAGVELVGIDPAHEVEVTILHQHVVAGHYLDADPTPWPAGRSLTEAEKRADAALTAAAEAAAMAEIDALLGDADTTRASAEPAQPTEATSAELAAIVSPPPARPPRVVAGASLARTLGVGVGDRVHVTAYATDGTVENVFFEIAGLLHTGNPVADRSRVLLHIDDAQRLMHLGDAAHEVVAVTASADHADRAAAALDAELTDDRLVAESWRALRPDIDRMVTLNRVGSLVMIFIIFFVATLGVVNTMLMSVLERTRELGVLKAIGMSGGRIVALIVAETALLTLAAAAIGTALGVGLDLYLVYEGWDLSAMTGGFSIAGVGLGPVLYGKMTVAGVVAPGVILGSISLLASLYPAIRAARMTPAIGMRET